MKINFNPENNGELDPAPQLNRENLPKGSYLLDGEVVNNNFDSADRQKFYEIKSRYKQLNWMSPEHINWLLEKLEELM